MTRRTLPVLLALVLFFATLAAVGRGAGEVVLFDGPKGAWLGALREDAPLVVLEEREGWRRVRLEGWTMVVPTGGAAATGTPGGADSVAIVQGVLAPPLGLAGQAGAGVLVLLVRDGDALDSEHHKAGEDCSARLAQKDRELDDLRADSVRAFNSSDNFREAAGRNDQAKARLAAAQRERRDLIRACRARAQQVFEGAVAQRAISDGSGRFEFRGIVPGRYRVVAFESAGDDPRTWSFSFMVEGVGTRVLDPAKDSSPVPADWGLR
jgi:hypothetical protein